MILKSKFPLLEKELETNTRTIFTPPGKLTFKHTYYCNKKTKQYAYLLDQVLNIPKYQKFEIVLQSKILDKYAHVGIKG